MARHPFDPGRGAGITRLVILCLLALAAFGGLIWLLVKLGMPVVSAVYAVPILVPLAIQLVRTLQGNDRPDDTDEPRRPQDSRPPLHVPFVRPESAETAPAEPVPAELPSAPAVLALPTAPAEAAPPAEPHLRPDAPAAEEGTGAAA